MPSLSAMPPIPQETIILSERQQKALDTTLLRSETLLTVDGYELHAHPSLRPGLYTIRKPEATLDKKTGEIVEEYIVDITAPSCTCKMFEFSRGVNCKHLRATLRHIGQCYNLLAPMLAQSGLTIPAQFIPEAPKTTTEVSLTCPHCGHGSTIPVPDYPGQRVCISSRCLKTFDEVQSPEFGTRPAPAKLPGSTPLKFSTAPNPPAPSAPKPARPGRGIPYCQNCTCVMSAATCERTQQEGHLCMICGAFQPLGAYRAHTRPNDNYLLDDGTRIERGHSHDLTDDDLLIGN